MGIIFRILTSIAGYGCLALFVLSLTAGLYMLAELAEEYPSLTGRALKWTITAVICLHVILCIDGLPWMECLIGIISHMIYSSTLNNFPFVVMLSPRTIAAMVAILVSHYLWFSYFMNLDDGHDYSMQMILGFFVTMVWAVPCGLLISLSINENVLPYATTHSGGHNDSAHSKKGSTVYMTLYNFLSDIIQNLLALKAKISFSSPSPSGSGKYSTKKSY